VDKLNRGLLKGIDHHVNPFEIREIGGHRVREVIDCLAAILATVANSVVEPIHDRMPVILDRDEFGPWLAGEDVPIEPCPPVIDARSASRLQ